MGIKLHSKQTISLIAIFITGISVAQCPAPMSLAIVNVTPTDLMLEWTEGGTALAWEVAVVPNYIIGDQPPSSAWIPATVHPFVVTGLDLPQGCTVFFVRAMCSPTDVSPWSAIAYGDCPADVYDYFASLSNDSFSINDGNSLLLYPNPSGKMVQLNHQSQIDKVSVSDSSGKVVLIQTKDNNAIDVEHLMKGIYFIEVDTENGKIQKKFIKE